MTAPKYKIGQTVRVEHHMGSWTGEITYRADTGTGGDTLHGDTVSGWEYEVRGAPEHHPENPPGYRWYPLVWEEEIIEVLE